MNIVIIGSGNVATHLAKALYAANLQISQVWSYHNENASRLAGQVNAKAVESLANIDSQADLCLIAVKDDAIPEVAEKLSFFKGLIAHTSGAVHIDVFAGKFENYGVFYPLQTFSKSKAVDFNDVPLCVEANNEAILQQLKAIGSQLSKHVIEVASEKREILHLAAVFACNFTNHLYALAAEILDTNGLDFNLMRPLITETASKVQQEPPLAVQTGPAIRNDEATLKKHEALLADHPRWLEIYKTLSESIKKSR